MISCQNISVIIVKASMSQQRFGDFPTFSGKRFGDFRFSLYFYTNISICHINIIWCLRDRYDLK